MVGVLNHVPKGCQPVPFHALVVWGKLAWVFENHGVVAEPQPLNPFWNPF